MSQPLRVLIVDDSEDDALLIVRQLQHKNYDVEYGLVDTAETMSAALARQTWDIIISDHAMPHFSALTALALLKEIDLDTPFIIVSGKITDDTAAIAMKEGAGDYISKNHLSRLVPAVEREMQDAEVRRKRKHAEMELEKYREHLEELVVQRTTDLVKSNEKLQTEINRCKVMEDTIQKGYNKEKKLRQELEEQIKRRTEFIHALVHELKTPLTPVLAASDVLTTEETKEPGRTLARTILAGALDLNKRIDELLDAARGEIGILFLKKYSIETHQLLYDVVDNVTPEATQRGLAIRLKVSPSLPRVWADGDRLRQMMLLLLDNALKFTQRGDEVIIGARKRGSFVAIEVQDTGPGIAKEEQRWLFKPYYSHYREGKRTGGLGLGLSLFKMLAELHGGRVWVHSQLGRGATFGFSVPLDDGRSSGNEKR